MPSTIRIIQLLLFYVYGTFYNVPTASAGMFAGGWVV